jgi:nucleoside-diphosphate-sugar epimerase
MLASHAREAGLKVHIFRPFSGYGSDQALDYPFPSFIDRAKRKANPFHIWGSGEQVRDFIHIDDVVNGAIAGCNSEIEVANLCTGIGISFNELAKMMARVADYEPTFQHLPSEPSGVHCRVGDPTLMKSFYTPKISLLEGIERTFAGL